MNDSKDEQTDSKDEQTDSENEQPYSDLTPDLMLDAVDALGFRTDARLLALNSYENRVYQIGIEDAEPVVVKFYRPGRWSDEQIIEEHRFTQELAALEIPVVEPMTLDGRTLHEHAGYRYTVYRRQGGHAPALDDLDNLFILGRAMGRIHAVGAVRPFEHRPALTVQSFGVESREFLLSEDFVSAESVDAYDAVTLLLIDAMNAIFDGVELNAIRLHGDCHLGNVLWRDDAPHFVDFDDARMGPAIQDLWMMLSGPRPLQLRQLSELVDGYSEFHDFDSRELVLIEALRSLRLMHHAAWLARRWNDPAFPPAFPWFNTSHYWAEQVREMEDQLNALEQPPLTLQ